MSDLSTGSASANTFGTAGNAELWDSLKQAIANSSGFKSWRCEQSSIADNISVEKQVRLYLRETLETLAY